MAARRDGPSSSVDRVEEQQQQQQQQQQRAAAAAVAPSFVAYMGGASGELSSGGRMPMAGVAFGPPRDEHSGYLPYHFQQQQQMETAGFSWPPRSAAPYQTATYLEASPSSPQPAGSKMMMMMRSGGGVGAAAAAAEMSLQVPGGMEAIGGRAAAQQQSGSSPQLQFQMQHQLQLQRSAPTPVRAAGMLMGLQPDDHPAPPPPLTGHHHHHHHQHHQEPGFITMHHHLQHHSEGIQAAAVAAAAALGGGAGTGTCKECGNQAKKDCEYGRCRTCCKSRGFECATHVKSTWVPAAKRRERQVADAVAAAAGQPRPKSKRNRAIALQAAAAAAAAAGEEEDITAATPTTSMTSPSSPRPQQQDLPSEVRAQAVFKCVKVTGVGSGDDEYAYQTVVKIGGRIFKGVLQDHGLDTGSSDSASFGELQLGAGGAASSVRAAPITTTSPLLDPGLFSSSSQQQ